MLRMDKSNQTQNLLNQQWHQEEVEGNRETETEHKFAVKPKRELKLEPTNCFTNFNA